MGVIPIPVVQVPATKVVIKSMVITLVYSQGDSYALCIYIYIYGQWPSTVRVEQDHIHFIL